MNRRDPLILVAEPDLVSSGLWPDRHVAQTPLWEVAENVQFAGGKVQRRVPNSLIPVAPLLDGVGDPVDVAGYALDGIGQLQASNGVRWIFFARRGKIFRWYGPAAEYVGLLPGAFAVDATSTVDAAAVDFTPWGNWMIANEGQASGAYIFKPGSPNTFLPLDNAPQDAVAYFKKRNQVVAVGHGVNRRQISFSDADDITLWTAAADNLAGMIPLEELNTPTKAACHFGPSIAVFGENQLFEFKWIGAPNYYGQNKLLDGIGAVGKKAVCSDGRILYGFGRNGFWKSDGMQYSYIDEVVARDYIQDRVNWDQRSKIAVQKNDITGCIEVSFPAGNSLDNNEAWAYDPRYGGWSPVIPFNHMALRALLDKPLQGQPNGNLELVSDNPAVAAPLKLETKAMLIQRDNNALHIGALIDEVELFAHKADKVQMQYGVAEFPEGPFSWTNPEDVTTKQVTYKLEQNISGTYHKLRFSSYEDNWTFDLQGFALFGEIEGQKRDKL